MDELAIPKEYFEKRYVPGLAELAAGLVLMVPTTIYNISGDDTSGVAGVGFPDGTFIAAQPPKTTTRFWDFDETHEYVELADGRVVGNSWRIGEVVWDGSAVGSIHPDTLAGEDGDKLREPVNRRMWTQELAGDRPSASEQWRALRRGATDQVKLRTAA